MDNEPDLLVVGGGPAGAITARCAAEKGADTLLIDKKEDPSRSSLCGGLVSVDTWQKLGSPESAFLGKINGAIIHTPDDTSYTLSATDPRAIVLDRNRLNQVLLHRAEEKGVRVKSGLNLIDLDGEGVQLKDLKTEKIFPAHPKFSVGADGPASDVRRLIGGDDPPGRLYAIQADARSDRFHEDLVEVYFGSDVAPGFFAWVIPTAADRARVGLATEEGSRLTEFLANLMDKVGPEDTWNERTGTIPIGVPGGSPREDVLLVGDAAGQVKPTTGGGLYPITFTAEIAGDAVAKGLNGLNNPNAYYREEWMRAVGRRLEKEILLHKVLGRLSDEDLNSILELLDEPKVAELLIERGDTDHLYSLAKDLLKTPSVLTSLLRALPTRLGWKLRQEIAG